MSAPVELSEPTSSVDPPSIAHRTHRTHHLSPIPGLGIRPGSGSCLICGRTIFRSVLVQWSRDVFCSFGRTWDPSVPSQKWNGRRSREDQHQHQHGMAGVGDRRRRMKIADLMAALHHITQHHRPSTPAVRFLTDPVESVLQYCCCLLLAVAAMQG